MFTVDTLSSDNIGITDSKVLGWRASLSNDNLGQAHLADYFPPDSAEYAKVMAAWGDTPTVAGPTFPEAIKDQTSVFDLQRQITDLQLAMTELFEGGIA